MRALVVYAHPEPKSFNGALLAAAVEQLGADGYDVEISDLYAQGFNPVAGPADVTERHSGDFFSLGMEQMNASQNGLFAPDIAAEIARLRAADLLILQFPMWWFSMPAIMKGWIDRVFAFGSLYDFGRTWDAGVMNGKRAMLSVTASAPSDAFLPDGRNGDMERVLWPIHAGILRICGYDVLPPFVTHGIPFVGQEVMQAELVRYKTVLSGLASLEPLFFHDSGDIDGHRLRADVTPATPAQHRGQRFHIK